MATESLLNHLGLTEEIEKEIDGLWKKGNYSLNIPVIDLQHLWLIFLIFDLEKLNSIKLPEDQLKEKYDNITYELINFTVEHFSLEEGIFMRFDYPDFQSHKKQHQQFINVLKERVEETTINVNLSIEKLIKFLKNWLFSHIIEHDHEYKNYFTQNNIDINLYCKNLITKKLITIDKAQALLYNRITNSREVKEILNEDIVSNITHVWNAYNLSIHIPIIDLQHIWLIKMVVELDLASKTLGTTKRDEIFKSIIKNAVQYTKDHFFLEEKIMEKFNYPGLANHVKQHNSFIDFIQLRNKQNKEGNKLAAHNLVVDLKEWLLSHIAVEDKQITSTLKEKHEEMLIYSRELMDDKLINIKKNQLDLYNRVIGLKKVK
jgi:hemerythrin-like metal-binding protein